MFLDLFRTVARLLHTISRLGWAFPRICLDLFLFVLVSSYDIKFGFLNEIKFPPGLTLGRANVFLPLISVLASSSWFIPVVGSKSAHQELAF